VINHIDKFLSEEQNEREESLLKLFWKVSVTVVRFSRSGTVAP
jgi:hypothetical protein